MSDDEHAEALAVCQGRVGSWVLGKWQLDGLLGVGGMGAVYAAHHRDGRAVAIKVLHPHLCRSKAIKRRFLREGQVANRVGHPGAVAVLDEGETEGGDPFLVMERLEGHALESSRGPNGRVDARMVVRVAVDVLDVLDASHRRGVVHRDIKPDNVFVCSDGSTKVLDFGIASVRDAAARTRLTAPGSARGTPGFMAPEQARGEVDTIDARTDLWAVGATMFSLLLGRSVHEGATPLESLFLGGMQPAPPIRSLTVEISDGLASAVDKALAFDRANRFSSAAEMRDALVALTEPGHDALVALTERGPARVVSATTLPESIRVPAAPPAAPPPSPPLAKTSARPPP